MTIALPLRAQQQPAPQQSIRWAEPKCDIKPNNRDVNQGMLYLKSATTSRDAEQKKKDLADAQRTLTQAVTAGGQDKNPAAWYYLGRYYLMTEDAQGTDSALSKAQALKPECKDDIALWRRFVWVPTFNAGIAAWQANNADSAIVAFRRAGYLLPNEPTSFKYAATLFYNTGHADSAVVYFRKAADIAATDPKFAQDRKDALFNLGRIQQSMQKMPDAMATYRQYLALYPGDPEILAALGSAYMQSNQKDSAFAIYRQIVGKGDSIGYYQLYKVGAEISSSVPEDPDTAKESASCRTSARSVRPPLTAARIRARCDSVAKSMARDFQKSSNEAFSLATQALDASLRLNPYNREALIFRANTALGMRDSATALTMSRRLVQVDPMSRVGLKIMASAQAQNHNIDSAVYYFKLSDSTLIGDVSVSQFDSTDTGRDVKVLVTNPRDKPNAAYKLLFEFVDLHGTVVATDTLQVNAIQPGQSQQFDLHPKGPSIAAWRYKKE
jgi:tetratricopeptide (TPR) repeat protein